MAEGLLDAQLAVFLYLWCRNWLVCAKFHKKTGIVMVHISEVVMVICISLRNMLSRWTEGISKVSY